MVDFFRQPREAQPRDGQRPAPGGRQGTRENPAKIPAPKPDADNKDNKDQKDLNKKEKKDNNDSIP
jgi:hypothetical protein